MNATYIGLIWELIGADVSPRVQGIMRARSVMALCLFGIASVVALKFPRTGLAICVGCLIVYLRPAPPGVEDRCSE